MAKKFSIFSVFKALDETSKPLKRMTKNTETFSKSTQKAFKRSQRSYLRFSDAVKGGLAFAGVTSGIFLIRNSIQDLVRTGTDFEKTMVSATVKFPGQIRAGDKAFKKLENTVRKLGASTEFTASEVAQGLEYLALAGFDANQAMSLLPGTLDLATSAQIDLGRASDIASDTLGAFGMMTSDTGQLTKNFTRVMDVMAKTTTSANTNMEALFETFVQAGPVATGVGQSIETVSALAGQLANSGIKASLAGTTLKNMFLKLAAPAEQGRRALDALGVVVQDADGNMRDMLDIMEDVENSTKRLGDTQRSAALNIIFGQRAVAGANALLKTGTRTIKAYRKALENSGGSAKEMADVMRRTLDVRLKVLGSALEALKLNVFKALAPVINDIVASMTDAANAAATWARANEKNLQATFIGIVTAIKMTGGFIKYLVSQVKELNAMFGGMLIPTLITVLGLFKVFNLLMSVNPIVLAITAIAAVILLIKNLITDFTGTMEKFKKVYESIKGFFGKVVGAVEQRVVGDRGDVTAMSSNAQVIKSQQRIEERSTVDVNFNNMPKDAELVSSGGMQGLKLNVGSTF